MFLIVVSLVGAVHWPHCESERMASSQLSGQGAENRGERGEVQFTTKGFTQKLLSKNISFNVFWAQTVLKGQLAEPHWAAGQMRRSVSRVASSQACLLVLTFTGPASWGWAAKWMHTGLSFFSFGPKQLFTPSCLISALASRALVVWFLRLVCLLGQNLLYCVSYQPALIESILCLCKLLYVFCRCQSTLDFQGL